MHLTASSKQGIYLFYAVRSLALPLEGPSAAEIGPSPAQTP